MKKLLLLLLCFPIIGWGQDNYNIVVAEHCGVTFSYPDDYVLKLEWDSCSFCLYEKEYLFNYQNMVDSFESNTDGYAGCPAFPDYILRFHNDKTLSLDGWYLENAEHGWADEVFRYIDVKNQKILFYETESLTFYNNLVFYLKKSNRIVHLQTSSGIELKSDGNITLDTKISKIIQSISKNWNPWD